MVSDFLLAGKFYLARGKYFVARKFRSFAELSAADRLFAASLRDDASFASVFVELADEETIGKVEMLCIDSTMVSIVLSRIASPQIADSLRDLPLFCQLLRRLRPRAAMEAASFAKFEEQLRDFASQLGQTNQEVAFIKGPAVGRLVYAQPRLRLSSDFDVVVRNASAAEFCRWLEKIGYTWIADDPGWCEQYGAGPTAEPTDVLVSPSPLLVSCDCLAFKKPGFPIVEVKTDPLERGIAMRDPERFWKDCRSAEVDGQSYKIPSLVDCLAIALLHLHKDDFRNWRLLYDISRLCNSFSDLDWRRFIRIAIDEGVQPSCFAGLALAQNWLSVAVPAVVFEELSVGSRRKFLPGPQFRWNSNSLPTLMRSTAFGGDGNVKLLAIRDCFFPSRVFIDAYYGSVCRNWLLAYLFHWVTLALPAGATRRILGKLWRNGANQGVKRIGALSN